MAEDQTLVEINQVKVLAFLLNYVQLVNASDWNTTHPGCVFVCVCVTAEVRGREE